MKKEKIAFVDNCFDWFRVYSALIIIMEHSVMHLTIPISTIFGTFLNSWIGLFCLFTLTGFLVPASLDRSKNAKEYLFKRFRRLYPSLWLALFVSTMCLLVIGEWNGLKYNCEDIVKWLFAQLSVFQFYTPSTIRKYGVGNPNGSLWTISMEIQVYILILISWKWLVRRSDKVWVFLILFGLVINIVFGFVANSEPTLLMKLVNVTCVPYMYVFLIGMYSYSKFEKLVPILTRYFPYILIAYIVWYMANHFYLHVDIGHYTDVVTGLFVCILTISGGYKFGKKRLKIEISYELYVYHMIVINAMVMFGLKSEFWLLGVVIVITGILAMLSHLLGNIIIKPRRC